jgi:aldose 1-epimerase
LRSESFGTLKDGTPVRLYTLTNQHGLTMKVSDYGAIITSLMVPDAKGNMADVVLGYDRLEDYVKGSPYFGAVVGRYANRIARGLFVLDGTSYQLATNNQPGGIPCHLHGGVVGFDKLMWDAEGALTDDAVGLRFRRVSPDGEEGYPGNLSISLNYWLNNANELRIEYQATTDKPTPVNLTNHSYFNLGGHDSTTILDHSLMIVSDHITPVNQGLIPTGALLSVADTPFDFRSPIPIGARIDDDHPQLAYGLGYDHNYVLSRWDGKLQPAATLSDPHSGRVMQVWTTEPGLQFYSGNFLDGSNLGKGGHPYQHRSGLCLETQHFPDSPNKHRFPSTILRPDEIYRSVTVYRFMNR